MHSESLFASTASNCYVAQQPGSDDAEVQSRGLAMLIRTIQQAKRLMKIILGFTLLVLGAVLVFTPGPGWLVMLLGLGVLAAEFMWARKLLDRMKEQTARLRDAFLVRPHPPANGI